MDRNHSPRPILTLSVFVPLVTSNVILGCRLMFWKSDLDENSANDWNGYCPSGSHVITRYLPLTLTEACRAFISARMRSFTSSGLSDARSTSTASRPAYLAAIPLGNI